MKIIFVTGGARSGKSSFALREAEKIEGKKLFIATATTLDAEMRQRIEQHRRARGPDWDTVEEPVAIAKVLEDRANRYGAVLIDCLTLWLLNLGGHEDGPEPVNRAAAAVEDLVEHLSVLRDMPGRGKNPAAVWIVSNEVGLGIVPDNRAARIFRDAAGRLNRKIAQIADEAYFMVSGLPLVLKE